MKTFALVVVLLSAAACGGRTQALSTAKDLGDGVPNASAVVATGVGNRAELFLYHDAGRPSLLYVWYYDTQRYFGTYGALKGVLSLRAHDRATGAPRSLSQVLDLGTYGGDGEGQVTGTHLAQVLVAPGFVVDSVALAFSNPAGSKWDSDNGRNYRVSLGDR